MIKLLVSEYNASGHSGLSIISAFTTGQFPGRADHAYANVSIIIKGPSEYFF